jgi:cell division ATPase FtsA
VGDTIQLFLTKNGFLEKINELKLGGRIFTKKLSDVLGIGEESARILKEKYSNNALNGRTMERVKDIFSIDKAYWKRDLESGLKKIGCKSHFSDDIFIFGGAGAMPEIREVFSGMVGEPFCEAKIIYPNSIGGFNDFTKILSSSQYSPCLMIANSILKN